MSFDMDFVFSEVDSTKNSTKINIKSYGPLNFLKKLSFLDKIIVLWNRFCIIIYDKLDFDQTPVVIYTDFLIADIIFVKNYLFCLDSNDFVHYLAINPITFSPNPLWKFKICAKSILHICYCDENNLMTISMNFEGFCVQLHMVNDGLQLIKQLNISVIQSNLKSNGNEPITTSFICKSIGNISISILAEYFNVKKDTLRTQSYLLVYYIENNVYWNILNNEFENTTQSSRTIYTSPLPIHSIFFVKENDTTFLVTLKNGSIVKLSFDLLTLNFLTHIVYLYASIHNMLPSNDTIIYTDSETTWYSFEAFHEKNCKNKQIKLKYVNDLRLYFDKIIYITFSNIIYIFDLYSKEIFIKRDESDHTEFIRIPKDIAVSEIVQIDQKTAQKRNKELKENVEMELKLIKAIALSQHSYLVKDSIKFSIHAYSRYDSALEHTNMPILTKKLLHYFKKDVTILHIRLEINKIFTSIFNQINVSLNDTKFHLNIAITTKNNDVLNTSLPLNFPLKRIQDFIHPLQNNDIVVPFKICLKIVAPIRSTLEKSLVFWSVISSSEEIVTMINLIKISLSYLDYKQANVFEHPYITLHQGLTDTAYKYGGTAFEIRESSHCETTIKSFIKLPTNYVELITEYENFSKYISFSVYNNYLRKISTDEFKKDSLILEVENHTIIVKMVENNDVNMLEISGSNLRAVIEIRKLFSFIFYLNDNAKSTKWVVPQIHYTRLEDLRRNLNDELETKCITMDSMVDIANRFQQYTLGEMPF